MSLVLRVTARCERGLPCLRQPGGGDTSADEQSEGARVYHQPTTQAREARRRTTGRLVALAHHLAQSAARRDAMPGPAAKDSSASSTSILTSLQGAFERSGQGLGRGIGQGTNSNYMASTRDNTPLPFTNKFGVSTVLPGLGIFPKKVHDPSDVVESLRRDGAVILTGLSTELSDAERWLDAAEALPEQIFGDGLLAATPPVAVGIRHKQNAAELKQFYEEHWGEPVSQLPPWEPNCAHTDGEAYGDRYPPYLFLLFGHQSAEGGENGLVDSYGLLDEMSRDPALAETADLLTRVPVDQTQWGPDDSGLNPMGTSCISPIVQELTPPGSGRKSRRMVKMATGSQRVATVEQKRAGQKKAEAALHPELWDASDSPRRDTQMLAAFKDAAFAASAHAPRFKVQAGEALIIDNYRALHIREAYRDMDRFSWRVWMWADCVHEGDDCLGAPLDIMKGVQHYIRRGGA